MIENVSSQNIKYLWGLSLRQSIAVTFFGVLMAVSKLVVKMPLSVPGHTGVAWMAILTICCLCFREGRSGTLAGFISGILAVILFPEKTGILTFFKYFIPGVTMDGISLLVPCYSKRWYTVALTSAFCHLTKLFVNLVAGLIMNIPLGFLALGLTMSTISHFFFGFMGGLIGFIIYNKNPLKKLKL